jgi:hypothetical protein
MWAFLCPATINLSKNDHKLINIKQRTKKIKTSRDSWFSFFFYSLGTSVHSHAKLAIMCIKISVADPWYFGTDQDPGIRTHDLRIRFRLAIFVGHLQEDNKKKLVSFWSYI